MYNILLSSYNLEVLARNVAVFSIFAVIGHSSAARFVLFYIRVVNSSIRFVSINVEIFFMGRVSRTPIHPLLCEREYRLLSHLFLGVGNEFYRADDRSDLAKIL